MSPRKTPTGKIRRGLTGAAAAARVGANTAGYMVKRPFMSGDGRALARAELDRRNAEAIFERLTELRGTALKIAQVLSLQTHILPPAYAEKFERSLHTIQPLNKALIRKQFTTELGAPPEEIFKNFEEEAFAAASLGQVHRATLPGGETVAVKIQYPGIDKTIKSDIAIVRQALRAFPNQEVWNTYLDEIGDRLREEVDYLHEAEAIKWFAQRLTDDDLVFPIPAEDYTTRRILTMKYIDGLTLNEYIKTNPTRRERDRVAQRLWDLSVRQLYTLSRIHADTHPGNYLILEDGIGLLDFGCVKAVPPGFAMSHLEVMRAVRDFDEGAMRESFARLLNFRDDDDESFKERLHGLFMIFARWYTKALSADRFDFSDIKFFEEANDVAAKLFNNMETLRAQPHLVFIDRMFFGLTMLFHKMGARVSLRLPEAPEIKEQEQAECCPS